MDACGECASSYAPATFYTTRPSFALLLTIVGGCSFGVEQKDDSATSQTDPDDSGSTDDSGRDTDSDSGTVDDADSDGFSVSDGDCDDTDPAVHPGASDDPYDGVDSDCDGWSDNDADRDGFDSLANGGTDCDDSDAGRNPDAAETFEDGIDQDCDGYADVANAECESRFTLTFEDGSTSEFDGCVAWTMTPTYEFDPDEPPEVATLKLVFSSWAEDAFDCEVSVETSIVCEPGYYEAGSALSASWATFDCVGVADEYESSYVAYAGWLEITEVDTGTATGNLSGRPLWTSVAGNVVAVAADSSLVGSFAVGAEQIAVDTDEPADCLVDDGDADEDGAITTDFGGGDCDDLDPTVGDVAGDQDCDRVLTADDCDDRDASLGAIDEDADCDRVLTADDCDDTDSSSTVLTSDADCDGVLTEVDCDDADTSLGDKRMDRDCDGAIRTLDCNDLDASLGSSATDADCDGTVTTEDCDDADAASTTVSIDADCDGILTGDDCDDLDAFSTWSSVDGDCDGVLTADDCDDTDASVLAVTTDADCDGAASSDDCDDTDPSYGSVSLDADCDGFVTSADCDDANADVFPGAYEADDGADTDCDGVVETAPVAIAGYDASYAMETCSPVRLDATGSSDVDGTVTSYEWELVGAPAGSARTSADIETARDARPFFFPDVEGTYTFSLVVSDGGAYSAASTVEVTVTARSSNSPPVVNAGADQTTSGTAYCTPISYGASYECDVCSAAFVDLTGSAVDADRDDLSYAWTVTDGSSYGSLLSSTGSNVRLVISGAPATYGTAASTSVTVQLTVTDCMGATSTDDVVVTHECTGI